MSYYQSVMLTLIPYLPPNKLCLLMIGCCGSRHLSRYELFDMFLVYI